MSSCFKIEFFVGLLLILTSCNNARYPFIPVNPACPWDFSNHTVSRRSVPTLHPRFLKGSPPYFDVPSRCVRVVEGHTLRLFCQAHGDPPPVTSWRLDDNIVHNGRRHTVTNNTLTIRHTTTSDSGFYWFSATNSFGTLRIQIQVKVLPVTEFCGLRVGHQSSRSKRVIGGKPVSNPQTWPWMARLDSLDRNGRKTFCGAVFIHPMWVLTAAHCVVHVIRHPWTMQVRVGLYDVDDDLGMCQLFTPASIHTHQQFYFHPDHDVALLRLSRPVRLSKSVSPACLPTVQENLPPPGTPCHVLGWGFDANFIPSRVLVDGTVNVKSPEYCKRHFEELYTDRLMCTVGVDDACYGDSGGPLMCDHNGRWVVQGIVHGGRACANGTLYVNVLAVLSWIHEKMIVLNRYSIPNKLTSTVCPTTEPPPSTTEPLPSLLLPSPTPSCSLSRYPIRQLYLYIIISLFICILFT